MSTAMMLRHRAEFARAIGNHQYEKTPTGILFPKQRAFVQGVFETLINGRDLQIDPNTVPVEALNYLLKTGLKNSGGLSAWYIALFLDDETPLSTLTAATFTATLTEFTDYDETTRQAFTLPTDPSAGSFSNSAAPAVFTASSAVDPDDGVDIFGGAILSASAKSATTGKILCASKFSSLRNLKPTDTLTTTYTITATDAA